jgi:hypothetical protein
LFLLEKSAFVLHLSHFCASHGHYTVKSSFTVSRVQMWHRKTEMETILGFVVALARAVTALEAAQTLH